MNGKTVLYGVGIFAAMALVLKYGVGVFARAVTEPDFGWALFLVGTIVVVMLLRSYRGKYNA